MDTVSEIIPRRRSGQEPVEAVAEDKGSAGNRFALAAGGNASVMLYLCLIRLILAITPSGLEAGELPDRTGDPFRQDGILEFLSPDGSVCALIGIEVADDEAERAKGLMWRTILADTEGMLFIFDEADFRVFWMRNTFISLDIIFVSADRRVVNIAKQTEPLSDRLYRSEKPAQYVVEVVAGFCDQKGIRQGTEISWQLN
jgi:uncharacterized membrane protein (UPF0127 family)